MGAEELKVRREGEVGGGRREETRPDGSGGTAICDVGFTMCCVVHVLVAVIVLTLPA